MTGAFLLIGAGFMLVAAFGLVRMPDLLTRMHSVTKAGTLGAGLLLAAVGVHCGEVAVAIRAAVAALFLVLTAPVGAHLIGRAGYRSGVRLWTATLFDEFAAYRARAGTQRDPAGPA